MKQLLLPFCAILCLGLGCAGQTSNTPTTSPVTKPAVSDTSESKAAIPPAKSAAPDNNPSPSAAQPPSTPATGTTQAPDLTDPVVKTPCGADPPDEVPTGAGKPYVIGPLDVLQISVWGSPNLSTLYEVGNDGLISMHLIGQIKASGETKLSLAKIIRTKLGATVFECPPEVNIQVAKINSKRFFVYGEVGRPGEYPLVEDMTLMDAFASVGNFTPFANTKRI